MKNLQTVGQDYNKGFIVKSYYTNSLEIESDVQKNLFQVLYVDEGSIIVGDKNTEKSLIAPVLLCLNYQYDQKKIQITNGKGFSLFFMPEVINHGMIDDEHSKKESKKDYLQTEQLLIYPFEQSSENNPVYLPVTGMIRERILRMASNINIQLNNQPDNYWPCRGRSFLLEMLMLLQSLYKLQTDNAVSITTESKLINPVLRQIHTSYNDPTFSVKSLDLGKGLTKIKFISTFKKHTKTSPANYLTQLRCSVADNLLKNTLLSVDEISRRCGYVSENRLTADFQRIKKCTPLVWRSKFPNPYG